MEKISIKTKSDTCVVYIEPKLIEQIGGLAATLVKGRKALVISDEQVGDLYYSKVKASLEQAAFSVSSWFFPKGEQSKTLSTVEKMYQYFYEENLSRDDLIIALGGGVTGDMTGFAAATYQRGVSYVQIPTSVMAQVDSAIGGKTAVDMPFGKNMVGAFFQPKAVFIDPLFLKTLAPIEFANGWAEVIKYGCIFDAKLFETLKKREYVLNDVIKTCVSLKAKVIMADEFDKGERMILNFGHTLGHAIEKASNYQGIKHGEAVAIGMLFAARIGVELGVTPKEIISQIESILIQYDLPTTVPEHLSQIEILAAISADKKRLSQHLHFILLEAIGKAVIYPLTIEEVETLLRKIW